MSSLLLRLVLLLSAGILFFWNACPDSTLLPRFFLLSFLGFIIVWLDKPKRFSGSLFKEKSFWFLVSFYVWNLISCLWAKNFGEAIFESQRIFLSVFFLAVFYLYGEKENKTEENFHKILSIISLIGSLWLLTECFLPVNLSGTEPRIYGMRAFCGHKNLYCGLMLLFLASQWIGYKIYESSKWKKLAVLNILLLFSQLLFLQSRAAYTALFVIFFILFLVFGFYKNTYVRIFRYLRSHLCTCVIMVFFVVIVTYSGFLGVLGNLSYMRGDTPIYSEAAKTEYQNKMDVRQWREGTGKERIALWANTLALVKDYPLCGVGAGNWQIEYLKHHKTSYWGGRKYYIDRLAYADTTFQRPHNDYLWILSELGVIGLLLFAGVWVFPLFFAFRNTLFSKVRKDLNPAFIYALFLLGYGVYAFFDFPKERMEHVLLTSAFLAFLLIRNRSDQVAPWYSRGWDLSLKILASIFLAFNLWIGFFRIKGEILAKEIMNYQGSNTEVISLKCIEAKSIFYSVTFLGTPLELYEGQIYFKQGDYRKAVDIYARGLKHTPYEIHLLHNYATSLASSWDLVAAKKIFSELSDRIPTKVEIWYNLSAIAYYMGDYEEALAYLQNCPQENQETTRLRDALMQKMSVKF